MLLGKTPSFPLVPQPAHANKMNCLLCPYVPIYAHICLHLLNGSMGTMRDIVWNEGQDPIKDIANCDYS
jgi:hypothetical protein